MKILIVDDDKFIRTVYKSAFEQENFKVITVENAEDAIKKVSEEKVDLVLLDIILPGKSGFEVLKEMKKDENLKNIPVVVFSSLGTKKDIDEIMSMGAEKYLPKDKNSPSDIVKEVIDIVK